MQFVDTHCHIHEATANLDSANPTHELWLKADDPNPDTMISNAAAAGVNSVICVGTTAADSRLAVEFAAPRAHVWASIGIHPHEAKEGPAALADLATLAALPKVVAVGECGLDYFYSHSPRQEQIRALRFQIDLALAHGLPLIFHVRDAFDDFWPILNDYQGVRGVVHSFTDTQAHLEQIIARGLYVGVNGIMTFTKQEQQLQMAKAIPLQNLLLETDAPFLTPKPFRGKVNMPAQIRTVADFLSDLRGEPLERLAAATTENALTLFNINNSAKHV